MKRTIYNFYCYQCLKQNVAAIPYPLDINNGKIARIYCPVCQAWIPYQNTNLSEKRYKLVHRNDWCIIDEDTPNQQLIYTIRTYQIANQLCELLNNGAISTNDLYHNLCF